MSTTHLLPLTRGAIQLLASALIQGAWYADKEPTGFVYRAGQILDLPEMDVGETPKDAPAPVAKAWQDGAVGLPLTEKQRDTAKACIAFFIAKAALPPGRPTGVLMRALGLAPED